MLLLLDKRMKHFDLSTGKEGEGNNAGTSEIGALENKWEG